MTARLSPSTLQRNLYIIVAILGGLTHRSLCQKAISIPPSTNWDGNDGPWSTFTIQIGTPPQSVRVVPSSSGSSLWAIDAQGCTKNDPSTCPNDRGGVYNQASSFTYTQVGTFELPLLAEQPLGLSGNGAFGYDNLVLSYPGGGGPTVNHSVVATVATKDFFLGTMGLTPWGTNFTNLNDPKPSILSLMRDSGQIPSRSWSYTAGAYYTQSKVFGSLIFGGYDTSRFVPNDLTIFRGADISRDLLVGLQAIDSGSTSLLPEPIIAYIDSTVSFIYLPEAACQRFEEAFGLVYDNETDLYTVNDTLHKKLQSENPSVVFSFGASVDSTQVVNITMPYGAFDLTAKYPLVANDTSYFPLRRAQNDTQYVLGRAFLQEAYLTVDYDRNSFSVSQAIFPANGVQQNLVSINTPGGGGSNSSTLGSSSSGGSKGLSTGATVGIAVAATVIGIAAIAGLVFWLIRRRKSSKKQPIEKDGKTMQPDELMGNERQAATEVTGDTMVKNELQGGQSGYRPKPQSELSGSERFASEMGGSNTFPSEMTGSNKFASEVPGDTPRSERDTKGASTSDWGTESGTNRTRLPSYPGTPSELTGDTGAREMDSGSDGVNRQWKKLAGLHEMP